MQDVCIITHINDMKIINIVCGKNIHNIPVYEYTYNYF